MRPLTTQKNSFISDKFGLEKHVQIEERAKARRGRANARLEQHNVDIRNVRRLVVSSVVGWCAAARWGDGEVECGLVRCDVLQCLSQTYAKGGAPMGVWHGASRNIIGAHFACGGAMALAVPATPTAPSAGRHHTEAAEGGQKPTATGQPKGGVKVVDGGS